MNVFQIERHIRRIGHNAGMPCWHVVCGLGINYTAEALLRELANQGLREKDWVLIENGLREKGASTLVDALSFIHCKSEIIARGDQITPSWFNKADKWTVLWTPNRAFNYGALRRGQDMLVTEDLLGMLAVHGTDDSIDKGYVANTVSAEELERLFQFHVRFYKREED